MVRVNYQMICQGGYESIIAYKESFNFALKSYEDQGNKKLDPPDIAMDFFCELDNARYSTFKTDYINGPTSKAIDPPKALNKIYLFANQWLKPKAAGSGYASTFATMLDHPEDRRPNADRRRRNRRSGKQQQQQEPFVTDSNKQDNKQKRPIKCFICEGPHFANKCPDRKQSADQDESGNEDERHAHMTWGEATMFRTYLEKQVNAIGYSGFRETEILLDNQADISIMRPGLLRAFKPAEKTVRVNGVGSIQLTVDRKGYLEDFFDVYASEHTKVNVLSFSEVEDTYDITYIPHQAFVVHLPERDLVFKRRGKLYIADFARDSQVPLTKAYKKAEEERAREAHELIRNARFPSYQEAVRLVEDGNIAHMPVLSAADVHRAYELYGVHPEYVWGKMVKKKASRAVVDGNLILDEKKQTLYTDVMHIDSNKFLVKVCEPLQLTLQCKFERETQQVLGMTLQGQLELLRSRGFIPTIVHTDSQSVFRALPTQFPGVVIDIEGAGDYVSKVDAKIWHIKELYRSVNTVLPWKLPPSLVKDLVMYAVSRINICRTTALNVNVCPKVLFTGLRVNYKKELNPSVRRLRRSLQWYGQYAMQS
jgi:hypothetical protein